MQSLMGYGLRRAWLAMGSDLGDRLLPLGLTGKSLSVLLMIEANPGVSQSRLAGHLDIKRANMTPLVTGFEERGLIERSPTDGRSHGLRLTTAGGQLVRKAWACIAENEERFLIRLAEADRSLLRKLLATIACERSPTE